MLFSGSLYGGRSGVGKRFGSGSYSGVVERTHARSAQLRKSSAAFGGLASGGGAGAAFLAEQFVSARREFAEGYSRLRVFVPAVFLFCVLIAQLWVRVAIVTKGYELEQLRQSALQADAELRDLKLKLAYASRPAEVAERAKAGLGMEQLERQATRRINGSEPVMVAFAEKGSRLVGRERGKLSDGRLSRGELGRGR